MCIIGRCLPDFTPRASDGGLSQICIITAKPMGRCTCTLGGSHQSNATHLFQNISPSPRRKRVFSLHFQVDGRFLGTWAGLAPEEALPQLVVHQE